MDDKLKPCPFCGGGANYALLKAWCTKCGISTKSYASTLGEYQREERQCIHDWNIRSGIVVEQKKAIDELVKGLQPVLKGSGRMGLTPFGYAEFLIAKHGKVSE